MDREGGQALAIGARRIGALSPKRLQNASALLMIALTMMLLSLAVAPAQSRLAIAHSARGK
jgi:hypothetical protein